MPDGKMFYFTSAVFIRAFGITSNVGDENVEITQLTAPKMEAVCSSEKSVSVYKST
jgi:hypothetical protein